MVTSPTENSTKTVLELDLASYSDVSRMLEENLDVYAVKAFEDQVQSFVDCALEKLGLLRDDIVLGSAGDNALLVFDDAATMHRFAEAMHGAVAIHNFGKTVDSAKRCFRMGAATGPVLLLQEERRIVGTTVARAVRLEAAAKHGQIIVDGATYELLPEPIKRFYGAEEQIKGKRDEHFAGRRGVFVESSRQPSRGRPPRRMPIIWILVGCVLCLTAIAIIATVLYSGFVNPRQETAGTGRIVLKNLPPDSSVLVDGKKVTTTLQDGGKEIEIQVAPGRHKLEIRCDGLKVLTHEVAVAAGTEQSIDARLEPNPIVVVPLKGEVQLLVFAPDRLGPELCDIREPESRPVRTKERVTLEATFNQPAHAFVILANCQGELVPLWPWNENTIAIHDISGPVPAQAPQRVIRSPAGTDGKIKGWRLDKNIGLESLILLARRLPLPEHVVLANLLKPLPPSPLRNKNELAILRLDRGDTALDAILSLDRGFEKEAEEVDQPLRVMTAGLQEHFEFIRVVRFVHEAE